MRREEEGRGEKGRGERRREKDRETNRERRNLLKADNMRPQTPRRERGHGIPESLLSFSGPQSTG